MKKLFAILVALTLALACMSMTAVAEEGTKKIGVLAPEISHSWVGGVAYYAQKAVEEDVNGIEFIFATSADAEEMASNMDLMVQQGCEVIVFWPQIIEGLTAPVNNALAAGVKVYNFDNLVTPDEAYADLFYTLSGDNYGIGVAGAEYIVSKIGTEGTVLIMDAPEHGTVAATRLEGFMTTMEEIAPDMEFVTIATLFNRADGLADMADALTAYDHIDAVFSMDDESSIGALQAIIEAGRTDIKAITGGGGCQEYFNMMLEEQYADIWVASATYSPSMITVCIENAVKLVNGEAVEQAIVHPSELVDRDNVADYLDAESVY